MKKHVFEIQVNIEGDTRALFVIAKTKTAAFRYVQRNMMSARKLTSAETVERIKDGVDIIDTMNQEEPDEES